MKTVRYTLPIFFIVASIIYGVLIIQLPPATLGMPSGPKQFPLFVCIGIFIFAVIDLMNIHKENLKDNEDLALLTKGNSFKIIVIIIGICIIYTMVFEWLGYLLATVLFLAGLLFYLNGFKKWLMNMIVTLVVSFSTWYGFTQLLQISLP
ncbi:putative tricarboxylic transport membrane protein [Virgibacillus halotolerans]|uniref:tripartite tricarboxylate transporter TctB family protein n=1 Tax=Virgibacillus halotolerans TaxID=1071053 RepID=UPI00196038D8|nr:tripartite tricarboxylate transporter TctB family protein [Virgibacillus halotolerans]MBM7599319.1 putative tricarboxylic transport membrane protein [Virgibacillus halotolerans]